LKITIDNHDGLGAVDYTQCLAVSGSFTLTRTLNKASVCTMLLDCNAAGRATPSKYGRVTVTSDAGIVLFTGYVALVPESKLAGAGFAGAMYLQDVNAISDELLLDQQSVPVTAGGAGLAVAELLQVLTQRVDPVRVGLASGGSVSIVGQFTADAVESWSTNAGALASMARAGYRVVNGQLAVLPIGATSHVLSDTAGTLDLSRFSISQARELANDVTVCGESEPHAYVTDIFQGDGTTTTFNLTRTPLRVTAVKGALVSDSFAGPALNTIVWAANDPAARFSITAAGLAVNGGNGIDGQTTLTAIDNVEMGGSLVLTAGGVEVSAESDGYIGCFYDGSVLLENLFAGFHVTQSGGNTVVVPIVMSAVAGAAVTLMAGHAYSFRLRHACAEMQRVPASYYVDGSAGEQVFGGGLAAASAQIVMEVQDTTGGVNQPTVVLYDGQVITSPALSVLCAVNSTAFTGSIGNVALEQTGTAWVRSQPVSGSAFTRRIGLATAGADCKLETADKLVFYATSVPAVSELVMATYRTAGRAVARLINQASVTAQGNSVVPGVSRWIGSVTSPAARSSADCENAALALLAISTSPSAAWAGTSVATNPQQSGDIWPGDVLTVQATGLSLTASLVVKTVSVTYVSAQPEVLNYAIGFSNDWADAVAVKISNAVPKDVWLPQTALAAATSLQSLSSLTAAVTSTQITVSAGVTAPTGGWFEVRRVDWQFGPGSDGTLVQRSPVANFSILREAAIEQYYVRMYDGSTPPNYSRFSSAICASVPL
jgi:hypothetical protein